MNTKKHTVGDKNEASCPYLIKRCLIYLLIFFTVGFLCSLFLSILFFNSEDPSSKIDIIGYISLYTSVILTALIFKKRLNSKKIVGGLMLGAMIFVFTYLISLTVGQEENGVIELLLRLGIILICVIISAIPKAKGKKCKKLKRH